MAFQQWNRSRSCRVDGGVRANESGFRRLKRTTRRAKSNFRPRPHRSRGVSHERTSPFSVLTAIVTTLSAAIPAVAAPSADAAAAGAGCSAGALSPLERRIHDEAARGLPALIGFVRRTQPFYQLQVVETIAWLHAEHEQRNACMRASASGLSAESRIVNGEDAAANRYRVCRQALSRE